MDPPKLQDHTTVLSAYKKAPPLKDRNSTNIGGMWTLKHDTISQKLYELLINKKLKGDTAMYIRKFYNHIKM